MERRHHFLHDLIKRFLFFKVQTGLKTTLRYQAHPMRFICGCSPSAAFFGSILAVQIIVEQLYDQLLPILHLLPQYLDYFSILTYSHLKLQM